MTNQKPPSRPTCGIFYATQFFYFKILASKWNIFTSRWLPTIYKKLCIEKLKKWQQFGNTFCSTAHILEQKAPNYPFNPSTH